MNTAIQDLNDLARACGDGFRPPRRHPRAEMRRQGSFKCNRYNGVVISYYHYLQV